MAIKNDGGTAFPFREEWEGVDGKLCQDHFGMSLRDWFAGLAMQATLSNYKRVVALMEHCVEHGFVFEEELARQSYLFADAMITRREKGGSDAE